MNNAQILPILYCTIRPIINRWCVTIFVILFSAYAWSSDSCIDVIDPKESKPILSTDFDSIKEVWSEIVQINRTVDGAQVNRPDTEPILQLTKKLADRINSKLQNEGYTGELIYLESRYDLLNYVPPRWGVKITGAPRSTWMGKVVDKALRNTEIEFIFDPYGLHRNNSEGGADYTGITQISFGIHQLYELKSNFIDSLLHEIHHASNHKKLKAQDPSGIYAEAHSIYRGANTPQHQFSKLYPYYFHFDELAAYSKEIAQLRRIISQTLPDSNESQFLKNRLNGYIELYNTLYAEAIQVIELAKSTFQTEDGRKNTVFFIDKLHKNSTAQIWIKLPNEVENSFKFTIWVPGITQLNHDIKSYRAVYKEILTLRKKILRQGIIKNEIHHN